jgi:hypothetical protein
MKNFILHNKLKLVYTVILLMVIAVACNMPVTQTESAGNMMIWTVPAENSDAISKIDKLHWLASAKVTKNESTNNGKAEILYTAVLSNSSDEQVNSYRKELEAIGGITSLKITPLNYDVKRPLYSAALHNFFSVNIDATGMSDQDLEAEVQRQLKENGVDMKVYFKTGPDGRRDMSIEKKQDNNDPKSYEIRIDDKNGQEKIKLVEKKADPDKFKGKSDEEIRKMIKEENPDVKDSDIKIIREGDNVQVKVEVEKKEQK